MNWLQSISDMIAPFANFASVLSFVFSLITLLFANRIKSILEKHRERESFRQNGQTIIDELSSFWENAYADKDVLLLEGASNEDIPKRKKAISEYYRMVAKTFTVIIDDYSALLGYRTRIMLRFYRFRINSVLNQETYDQSFLTKNAERIHKIISDLEKVQGSI